VAEHAATVEPERPEPGPLARWVRADHLRAASIALIAVALAWRAAIATRGYFSQDEFVIAARAVDTGLTTDYLFGIFNNHLMPGGLLVAWLVVRVDGLAAWPWVLLLTAGQAAVCVAFYRLLRSLLRPGWALLVPLCMVLFSPLTLEASSLWVVGLLMLPVQLAMILAIGAQTRYARTGRHRHVVGLVLAVALGLAFDTKALLIIPLLYLVTACLLCEGRLIASLWAALRRFWPGWVALTALAGAYVVFYLDQPAGSIDAGSPGTMAGFARDLIGTTLVPGLAGGPWRWTYAGDGPPLVDPPVVGVWLAWALLIVLVVVTVRARASASRAWLLLLGYTAMVTTLFALTRLGGPLGSLTGLIPRYVSDVVVIAALSAGVALLGLRDRPEPVAWPVPRALREPSAFAVGLVAVVVVVAAVAVGNLWSVNRFNDNWRIKYGRDYLRTAQAALAAAPPGTVLLEESVPDRVVAGYFWPDNLQSHFFRAARLHPVFVTEAENPSMFDDTGRIREATVQGIGIAPGPAGGCGYRVTFGGEVRIPLAVPAVHWPWWVYVGYLSSADSTVTFQLGDAVHRFNVHRGLNQIFFRLESAGDAVRLSVDDPGEVLCTRAITVGRLAPKVF